MTQVCCMYKNINVLVYLLVIVFAIASWVDINGLWVELPILVQELPEAWDLPSYMVIIVQLANIGPLVFTLSKLKCTNKLSEVPVIYLIIGIGAVSCLLLAFFWDKTTYVAGELHSTALLILNFFLALVDCTSSVVFLPFMAEFKKEYITAFFIGEGFSGLLPGLVALGQGAGQTVCVNHTVYKNVTFNGTVVNETSYVIYPQYAKPKFSVETFFFFLFGMLIACGVAFTVLKYSEFAKLEQITPLEQLEESSTTTDPTEFASSYELGNKTPTSPPDNFLDAADNINSQTHLLSGKKKSVISIQKDPSVEVSIVSNCMSQSTYFLFLGLTAWVNGLANGVLPSIQSYSALPYGNTQYHLSVTLGSIANPLACFLAFFLPTSSSVVICVLTAIGTGFAGYCVLLAALSPVPLLVGHIVGDILVDRCKCYYCGKHHDNQTQALHHCIADHSEHEVRYLKREKSSYRTVHYGVTGSTFPCSFDKVTINPENKKISYPVDKSPQKKVQKLTESDVPDHTLETPVQEVFKPAPTHTSDSLEYEEDMDENDLSNLKEIQLLLPTVLSELSKSNHLEDWLIFLRLLSKGKFPCDNIAFKLFLDVVHFYNSTNIHSIKYSKEVKQFWAVGMKLFKPRFIRFMGGFKAVEDVKKSDMKPCDSKINFVCPSVKVLEEEIKKCDLKCEKPGVLVENIDLFSRVVEGVSCKLSFDGKKVASGFDKSHGEVDLFGHEPRPTRSEKQDRLQEELNKVKHIEAHLSKLHSFSRNIISECLEEDVNVLYTHGIELIQVLSGRIKDLRQTLVKKNNGLLTLNKLASDNPNEQRYKNAISAVKISIHRISACISDLLRDVNGLGIMCASCRGVSHLYRMDNIVLLGEQENFVCLQDNHDNSNNSWLCKQRSEKWHSFRNSSKVTGSTIHRAVGLDTLKAQQIHFDKVFLNKTPPEPSDAVAMAMKHGNENELNAVATIVARILPTFKPHIQFHEEGCGIHHYKEKPFLVVSPDGSGSSSGDTVMAFEIKCPLPGKRFTTDVQYCVPIYYVCQLLSEMFILKCKELMFVSYTPESTAVHLATYDECLWGKLWDLLLQLYANDAKRPTRKHNLVAEIRKELVEYTESKVTLLGEFPSCVAIACEHHNPASGRVHHKTKKLVSKAITLDKAQEILVGTHNSLKTAHQLTRLAAKEVFVVMLSDLDRIARSEIPHAIPVCYGLSGYSLPVDVIRKVMKDVLVKCHEKGIHVPVISSDGQFYRNSVRGCRNEPLTMLQVMKDAWEYARKIPKAQQVKALMDVNFAGHMSTWNDVCDKVDMHVNNKEGSTSIEVFGLKAVCREVLYTPPRIVKLVEVKTTTGQKESTPEQTNEMIEEILPTGDDEPCFDDDAIDALSDVTRNQTCGSGTNTDVLPIFDGLFDDESKQKDHEHVAMQEDLAIDGDHIASSSTTHETTKTIFDWLKSQEGRRGKKWSAMSYNQFQPFLQSAKSINKELTHKEIVQCIPLASPGSQIQKYKNKQEAVNALSHLIGDGTTLVKLKSPKTLRAILKDMLSRKYPKHALNAIIATRQCKIMIGDWRDTSPFQTVTVGANNIIHVWYSQPEWVDDCQSHLLHILDTHHLFVNARSHICKKGVPSLSINKDAWKTVAEQGKTKLSVPMVQDLIDRQSNSLAQITFSEEVASEMRDIGFENEAQFCDIFRRWYEAEDDSGISAEERYKRRVELRHLLLKGVNFLDFPPPGLYVNGLPVVMFEGLLTNIDRRLQLFVMSQTGSYNVRAPTSLDSENFFGNFQDLDPKGTGVLRPDDVPRAMETASYLFKMRLDTQRHFSMRTSITERVYRSHLCQSSAAKKVHQPQRYTEPMRAVRHINLVDHEFDTRRSILKPKRKRGNISDIDKPARGSRPVRDFHRCDESKILPHLRYGKKPDTN